jgi:hypothetical protein
VVNIGIKCKAPFQECFFIKNGRCTKKGPKWHSCYYDGYIDYIGDPLKNDWERVKKAVLKVKNAHWDPRLKIFFEPKELRQADNRGIDAAIRRLKDSKEYSRKIGLHGAPSSQYPRNPFRYGNKVYALLSFKLK